MWVTEPFKELILTRCGSEVLCDMWHNSTCLRDLFAWPRKNVRIIIMTSAVGLTHRLGRDNLFFSPRPNMSMQRLESTQDKARKKTKINDSRIYIFRMQVRKKCLFPPPEYVGILDIRWNRMDVLPVAFNVNVFILFNNHAYFFTIPSSTAITIDTLILCTTISTHTETRHQGSK